MPAKPITQGKASCYLDHSTLCDAIGSNFMDAREDRPHYRRLLPIIQRVATEANLCIGWPHVYELAKWDAQKAKAVTEWLDALPYVWVHQTKRVMDSEVESVLRHAVGAAPSEPRPFSPSYLAAFDQWDEEAFSQGLSRTALTHIIEDARRARRVDQWDRESLHWATRLHRDRVDNPRSDADKRHLLLQKAEQALRGDVAAVGARLAQADSNYASLQFDIVEVADRVLDVYRADPQTFRCTRMLDALHEAFADKAGNVGLNSKNFKQLRSSALDIEHAGVAAAYCDVFTCDRLTSLWIGDRREGLGLNRQLARAELPTDKAFVDALERLAP